MHARKIITDYNISIQKSLLELRLRNFCVRSTVGAPFTPANLRNDGFPKVPISALNGAFLLRTCVVVAKHNATIRNACVHFF